MVRHHDKVDLCPKAMGARPHREAEGGMTAWQYALWGFFGGFAVDGLEFAGAIRRVGDWPWRQPGEPGPLPLAASVVIRIVVAAGLAAAAGSTGQVSGPFGAVAVGVAAPLLIEQLAKQLPLSAAAAATTPSLASSGQPPSAPTSQPASDPQAGEIQGGSGNAS
jgi:hypothetical protein